MRVVGIIPARYASTRFPGKPLALIGGKMMIERVYTQVSGVLADVYVATDDERIEAAVRSFGGNVIMTSPSHQSGTDRIAEAVATLSSRGENFDVVVNIQGDEPFISPSQVELLVACFNDPSTQIATLVKKIDSGETLFNPNSPKVIFNSRNFAMYFSRHPIPYVRGKERDSWLGCHTYYKHIGIYAYQASVLKEVTSLPQSPLEIAESLEQLRWLEAGYSIKVAFTGEEGLAVDTPGDLEKVNEWIKKQR